MANFWEKDAVVTSAPANFWEKDPVAAPPSSGGNLVEQGLAGVNEGVGNFLSLPNTIEIGLRSIGPAIGNALGGDFEMPTQSVLPDAGASYRQLTEDIGATRPETDDAGIQIARRIGQEIGANILPIASGPGKVLQALSTVGSGAGAAWMQQMVPDSALAELAGQVIGGGVPIAMSNVAKRSAMQQASPTLEQVRNAKTQAYKAVDDLGVQYSPQAYDQLVKRLEAAAQKEMLVPERHGAAASVLKDFQGKAGWAPTLSELDAMRQIIGRDLIKSSDGSSRHFGRLFTDEIDNFISQATPAMVANGDAIAANNAINNARALNQIYKRTEAFDNAIYNAELKTDATGSGGNINNAIRQRIASILSNPTKRRQFTPEQIAEMESLVRQGPMEGALRTIGKVAPGGNGLMTALNIGAVAQNPAMVAAPVLGTIAKTLADRKTTEGAKALRAAIANGYQAKVPLVLPETESALGRLAIGAAANQNEAGLPGQTDNLLRLLGLN